MTYYERNLPHWVPQGAAIFLTWRLFGSLPPSTLTDGLNSDSPGRRFARVDRLLDRESSGPSWLRSERIAKLVETSILKGTNELGQYDLLAYVVMPNHVHLLIRPNIELSRITKGIKGSTARIANELLRRTGKPFWQDESFDHWVRAQAEEQKIVAYIELNPVKARLSNRPEEWRWSSASNKSRHRVVLRAEA